MPCSDPGRRLPVPKMLDPLATDEGVTVAHRLARWLEGLSRLAPALFFVALVLLPGVAFAADGQTLGEVLPFWSVIPFVGMLLSIALVPMVAGEFWEKNRNQFLVALGWAAPVLAYLLYLSVSDKGALGQDAGHNLGHAIVEYVSFIALIGSLYVISGGILLRGDLQGRPAVNTAFLAIGAVIANVIGTTGASMLLIRPMLRTNSERKHTWHIPLFFIFLVSNIGGTLTPIGDPPLFLGYLRGVDFWWTLEALWTAWVPVVLVLLVAFYAIDTYQYGREEFEDRQIDARAIEPLRLEGNVNFLLLAGVIGAVLLLSPNPEVMDFRHYYAREIAMILLAGASMVLTPAALRAANDFSWSPILEVAALFVGIFITMIPATSLLQTHGSSLGLTEPWQYFWATGFLSAFLDNAPTYVTFAAMACGTYDHCTSAENLGTLTGDPTSAAVLAAISLASVFMGAGSYIGNGPNFMVRAIAEQAGYKMPSFFGYCAYAALFLGPVYLGLTLLWLI